MGIGSLATRTNTQVDTIGLYERKNLLAEHIGHIVERIKELRQLEKQLKSVRETGNDSQAAQHCGILNELTEIARSPLPPSGLERLQAPNRFRRRAQATLQSRYCPCEPEAINAA